MATMTEIRPTQVSPLTREIITDHKRKYEILKAAEVGHLAWLQLCLKNPESRDIKGPNGESSLHVAASNLNRNIVRYLIDQAIVDPNCLDKFNRNSIHGVIIKSISRKLEPKKVLSMVKLLNKYGVDLCQQDIFGAVPLHYAAMNGYGIICEYFISMKQELLCSRDQHNLCPSDWATVWGRKNCAKRIKKAEWDFNFKRRDQEIRKLKKFKDYFCRLQMEAVECMRHDVNFYSDVAFKSFMAEKLLSGGIYSNTLHEDELKNGLRRRLRKSGRPKDKSDAIEKISLQQQKRFTVNCRYQKTAFEGAIKRPMTVPLRTHKLTEDWKRPLSSKAGLPVQIISRNKKPQLRVDLTTYDGRPDVQIPNLPVETIRAECGDEMLFRMINPQRDYKTLHVDDNKKTRDFHDSSMTEIQFHLRRF
jgi:hypothetical protein